MKVEEKLGKNVFKVDRAGHISIDTEVCRSRCAPKYCISICPAKVYSLDAHGNVRSNPDGCLECGACVLVCEEEALRWQYPKAGFGVQYRFS